MFIRCKQHRPQGTRITLDGQTYHFAPRIGSTAPAEHVAWVEDSDHLGHFLAIREGYTPATDQQPARKIAMPGTQPADSGPVAITQDPAAELVAGTAAATDPDPASDTETAPAPAHDAVTQRDVSDMSQEDLQAEYRALNDGRGAPHNIALDTLREKVAELREEARAGNG